MKRVLIFLLLTLALAAGLGWLLYAAAIRYSDPDSERFPVRGIDISHHQGEIDWELLRTDAPSFVFMKATEGADFRDPRFEANWRAAGQAAIPRGAYHFFTFCTPGSAQAKQFIRVVSPDDEMLPPAVDVEFSGNCRARPEIDTIRGWLGDFLIEIERAYGRKPLIYVTRNSFHRVVEHHFEGYPLWVRGIYLPPRYGDRDDWIVWQYADRGRRAGIEGFVDLDVFNGDAAAFRAWRDALPRPQPSTSR